MMSFAIIPDMVEIPAGSFRMGDLSGRGLSDERPVREVIFARPFALGVYAVTFDEYDCFAKATGRDLPKDRGWGRGRRPVIYVSWDDAVAYCQWLSAQTGQIYRLPSEAEWEYACRAGTTTEYWWGDSIGRNYANCDGCGSQWDNKKTAPVGSFAPNPWGLYDMHGNVFEWCADCWNDSYRDAPSDGSAWTSGDCEGRVMRGGSWLNDVRYVRAAIRDGNTSSYRNSYFGFRVARDLT
jgi:formylglycine-generating enzyme required for sulfatase activity